MAQDLDVNYFGSAVQESNATEQLPFDLEAERSVLAACLYSNDAADEVCLALDENSFYKNQNKIVFEAIFSLVKEGITPDMISIIDKLRATNKLGLIGDDVYVNDIASDTSCLTNWHRHLEIVKRMAAQRNLIRAAAKIRALGFNAPETVTELVGMAEKELFQVTEKQVNTSFNNITDIANEVTSELHAIAERKGELLGVPTGFTDLDKLFYGLRGGDLVVLAARPGVGKTSFALNMATATAKKGTNVAFFSLEMSGSQIMTRVFCSETRIPLTKFRSGNLTEADWAEINRYTQSISDLKLYIDDTPGLNIIEARAKARRQFRKLKETGEKGLIIIDYLQLMNPAIPRRDGNRAVEVGEISRGLKVLAKELDVPIIALSQLNRSVEMRGMKNKRPMLSDLRESGSIEQDADIVMFIDRSMDEQEALQEGRPQLGTAEVLVAKHRNGPTRDITLSFQGEFTKFDNFSDESRYQGLTE